MSQVQITDLMGLVAAPLFALFVTLGIGICVNTCSLHIGCEKKSQEASKAAAAPRLADELSAVVSDFR